MSITRAQIARQLYAKGGNTGYSDFASPSSTTASQDFATQAVSGGQTDYSGGGGSYDYIPQPPMAQVKLRFSKWSRFSIKFSKFRSKSYCSFSFWLSVRTRRIKILKSFWW
jgi:hypothetical protein